MESAKLKPSARIRPAKKGGRPPFDPSSTHSLAIIRPGRLAQLWDVAPSTIFRMEQRGELPPRVKVGKLEGWTWGQLREVMGR